MNSGKAYFWEKQNDVDEFGGKLVEDIKIENHNFDGRAGLTSVQSKEERRVIHIWPNRVWGNLDEDDLVPLFGHESIHYAIQQLSIDEYDHFPWNLWPWNHDQMMPAQVGFDRVTLNAFMKMNGKFFDIKKSVKETEPSGISICLVDSGNHLGENNLRR